MNSLGILGIRGVPAAHGGFETFAEQLAIHLVKGGWRVTVYCQEDGAGSTWEDYWDGVHRVHIPIQRAGPAGTILFDLKATMHARRSGVPCLTLGYNTAIFSTLLKSRGIPNVINMDGVEWARAKWGPFAKAWFWLNDWLGCWLGDHLIADHPEIMKHLSTRVSTDKITTIAYGAPRISAAPVSIIQTLGLDPGRYLTVIARAEPENSILEIVRGFSKSPRGVKLVVLGNYDRAHTYQRAVLDAASSEVVFLGAIYEKDIVQALRFHSLCYVHGHQVGGTNPSLVEALGASNAIIAHDNRYNRWVAGDMALYFSDASGFESCLLKFLEDEDLQTKMRHGSNVRFENGLTWDIILSAYESLLERYQ